MNSATNNNEKYLYQAIKIVKHHPDTSKLPSLKRMCFFFFTIIVLVNCSNQKSTKTATLTKSPEEIGRLVIEDLLSRDQFYLYKVEDVEALHYAEACTAYGAIKLATSLHDKNTLQKLQERYHRIESENIPNTANHVDANVYGILPLQLYLYNNEKKYLDQGIELADGQWGTPLPNGMSSQTRFWIDDIYMIGSLQVQAYRASGEIKYLNRAALQIDAYIKNLQQPNGLFFHGEEAPFYWGRGNGWVAAGLAELLSELPQSNPHYNAILKGYQKMMKTLLESQGADGMWHQLIDQPATSFAETSSTAMFGFAMAMGVKNKLLPKNPYQDSYIKAWNTLTQYIDNEGKVSEVCVGTGQSKDVNYYLNRPKVVGDLHGQAPILWFANALLK
ncbi:glycoside hydrolase family 105 protein [Mangrovimonas sp. YM274]|uniref:glycoside hydrolase family 88/105 protein n=1 Tax=Mangrovimonas sp. YM274 TaxID=3070660 RepID=UPI0027DE5022|nr:glycoside hydrolase family 88 protein [Mangrovimonas sp. YM274]WMI67777.1 glycoside hydrolase family 88 protein [Mangrovimonas sp. YM274]